MNEVANMPHSDHAFPLFADAQKPDARKSGKARRMWLFVSDNKTTQNQHLRNSKLGLKQRNA